jgi:hypothetical protein
MAYMSCSQKYDSENDFQVNPMIDGVSAEIANYSGRKSVVNIPPMILEMPVVRIGDDSFKRKEMDCVIIPENVTNVGSRAFAYSSLSSITFSAGITEIGESAFAFCENLDTYIILPESVKTIEKYSFANCKNLPGITIPASVISVGENAFRGWNYRQTINVMGFENQAEADSAWQASWRNGCNARINYYGKQ